MNFNEYSQKTLLPLTGDGLNDLTVDEVLKGTSIMGGTGSGKTTASGRAIARKFLKEGWGGLVLCAKTDEADLWEEYCEDTGRRDDLLRFGKGSIVQDSTGKDIDIVFNPIDYELKRKGKGAGETQNITNIFMNMYRMGNRIAQEGDTKEERYWDTALKRCLNRIIELIKLSGEDLSFRNMVKVLATSNNVSSKLVAVAVEESIKGRGEQLNDDSSYCLYCLMKGYFKVKDEPSHSVNSNAYDMVYNYFTKDLRSMSKRTKSIVTESYMGLAEPFLSGLLYRHFAGATNIFPEQTYGYNPNDLEDTRKRIIVLDFSIKEYLDAGIMAQCAFKLMFQQAIERRDVKQYPVPVFLWCDEAQYFVNPYDQIFLTTARSSRTATVYLSQNISNYFAVMGSGGDATARVNSLMGNLSTKIFHANSDAATNEYASRLIGQSLQNLKSASVTTDPYLPLPTSQGDSIGAQLLPQVEPMYFTTLRTGGPNNNFKVDSFVVVNGRKWGNGKNFLFTTFPQKFITQKLEQ